MLQPPSPASDEKPIESGVLRPDPSQPKPDPPPGPAIISPVETSDPWPNVDNAEPSVGNQRRTLGGWFKTAMKRGNRKRPPHQMPSEESPRTSTPQTKTTPSNEQLSTMSPGQRVKVSVPLFSLIGREYLTIRLSGRLQNPLSSHRLVQSVYKCHYL